MGTQDDSGTPRSLSLPLGPDTLVIERRYEFVSILNDLLIGIWFTVGSVLFFFPAWETAAIWCFTLGSVELMIRPVIRLSRHLHLRRRDSNRSGAVTDF